MFEVIGILGVLLVVGIVIGVIGLVIGLLKFVLKIALIPLWLGLKLLGLLIGGVVLLALSPVLLVIGILILIPLLFLGGLIWAGVALVT
jgi:hypothetical protein